MYVSHSSPVCLKELTAFDSMTKSIMIHHVSILVIMVILINHSDCRV